MKMQLDLPKVLPPWEAERRAKQFLPQIQQELAGTEGSRLVAVNLENGDYVLGQDDVLKVAAAFRAKFPGQLPYIARVDGGPVVKFHGM